MSQLVTSLNSKIDNIIETREREFLSAYQSHMIEVQKELVELRREAEERELAHKQQEKFLSIEEELAWIRDETMKLREEINHQESQLVEIKLENQELEDDSKFLKDQIKEWNANSSKFKEELNKAHGKYEGLIRQAKKQNTPLPKELIEKEEDNNQISISQKELNSKDIIDSNEHYNKCKSMESKVLKEYVKKENANELQASFTEKLPLKFDETAKIDNLLHDLLSNRKK